MREMGLNCVRLGDFCWSRLEPREGDYRLDWLDDAIAVLGDHGIRTMLTLPTVGPPRWVSMQYPETLPVRRDGQRMPFGSRNHICINTPISQQLNLRLLDVLLERFSRNPRIFSWALGNEIGKQFACYCPICLRLFQEWLRQRYITIDKLNEAWGTVFWSQEYSDFDQVVHPLERPNPGLHLDWQRFRSDSMIHFCQPQIERIHEKDPDKPVTVNFRLAPDEHDCFELARQLDVVGANFYPGPMTSEEQRHSHYLDLFRGIGRQQPFWIMEAQTGIMPLIPKEDFQNPVGCSLLPSPTPGQIRLWAYASIAGGANMINYYMWQEAPFGDECLSTGILDHAGRPRPRLVKELKATIEELKVLEPFATQVVRSKVAVLFDYPSWWANRTYRLTEPFSHLNLRQEFVQTFYQLGLPCDIIDIEQLESYKVVVVSNMQIITADIRDRFAAFVRNGGHLLFTFRGGLRETSGQIIGDPFPGLLSPLLGMTIEESEPLHLDTTVNLKMSFLDQPCVGRTWTDTLILDGAEPLGCYADGCLNGNICFSCRRLEKGCSYYLGTLPDRPGLLGVLRHILGQANVVPLADVPEGVVVGERSGRSGRALFLINFNDSDAVCTCQPPTAKITVPAHDAVVVTCNK